MKYTVLACVLALSAGWAQAVEYGRVIASVPVVEQVSGPQRTCWNDEVVVSQPESHGGAIVGGIFGALLGNSFGRGSGNAAATAAGAIAGAMVGSAGDRPRSEVQTIRRCEMIESGQPRTVGYDVTYEYAGQRYTTRMNQNPGDWVQIRVAVDAPTAPSYSPPPDSEPVYVEQSPTTIVEDSPEVVYESGPVYLSAPPPVYFGLGFGYRRSWGGDRHWDDRHDRDHYRDRGSDDRRHR